MNSLSDLMIGKGSSRGACGGINLEVWFPQQNAASVFLESSITDAEQEQFYETLLFALYAARQIANLGAEGASLAYVLQTTDTNNPLRQAEERLDEVRVFSPRDGRGGRKGFTCTLRPHKRASFKLNVHGFGMMGGGVGYYAPTSTLALLYFLLNRRKDNATYQRALAATAENVGILGSRGAITVTSQSPLAMEATSAAWGEAFEQATLPDEFQLSPQAKEACEEHDINFAALVAEANRLLPEALAELSGEGSHIALPDAIAQRTCLMEVISAANLSEEETIERASAAVLAAETTGDQAMIGAAYAHLDRVLAEVIEDNDLGPVVEALNSVLFTGDTERAAESQKAGLQKRSEATPPATDASSEIRKFASLRDDGLITDAEFEAKKKQLLGL